MRIRLQKGRQLAESLIMAFNDILNVFRTGIAWCQRVCALSECLRDDLQFSFPVSFPVEAEHSPSEVLGCVNNARGVTRPEPGFRCLGHEVRITSAEPDASGESFQRACVGSLGSQLLEFFRGIFDEVRPVSKKRERAIGSEISVFSDSIKKLKVAFDRLDACISGHHLTYDSQQEELDVSRHDAPSVSQLALIPE